MSTPRRSARTAFSELALLQREINQLFERLGAWGTHEPSAPGEWCPGVDVFESRGRLVVVVEVPGLPAESLKVVLRDGRLIVSGERGARRAAPTAGAFVCLERPHGRFRRTIPVDAAVDLAQAEARLATGLLTIVLPRVKDRRRRETAIPVTTEPRP